ncbi:M20 family metallopeptidase [Peribacillus muralis]|uniref:M20 family metallopeptidase n=1 Tax=Peribacillus muralis TaxID=264697 RepID=UPI001F4D4EF1|nr:M20 family metallopeptidase [Peribacillus muralis]MCK1992237.1 M20 family metallopeptidase [Peribacillus muralis]MCK2012793.1 M20 family metallopeptidase [Peribacillus muralis]
MGIEIVKSPQQIITDHIDHHATLYRETSQAIHAKPEIGNQEFFASDTLTKILQEEGFDVTRNIAGHETGFIAKKTSAKKGPTIAFLAEYDALPGLGHACGHNIIGATSVAAGISLAQVLEETGGEVIVFGTPAEEGGPNGSAKGSFVKHGLFDEVDAAILIHPAGQTGVTSPFLAVDPLDFHFYGKSAHAAAAPEQGVNALDAVIQLFNGINALRQQLPAEVKIHGIITNGGEAPNIIPEYASARFYIRATTWKLCQEVSEKIRDVAKGAALATGSTVKVERFQNEVLDFIINPVLDELLAAELTSLGEAVAPRKESGFGSTDAGNVSHVVPTAHPYIKIGPDELIAHTNEFRDCAKSLRGDEAILIGAKALALTGYTLISDREVLDKVKAAFHEAKQTEKV